MFLQEQTMLTQEQIGLMRQKLERLDDCWGNLDEFIYEGRVRTRILFWLIQNFGMGDPVVVLPLDGLIAPEINRLFQQALRAGLVRHDEIADLQETDIIITDQEGGSHAVVEVSVTADDDDIMRAERRALIMGLASGAPGHGCSGNGQPARPARYLGQGQGSNRAAIP